MKKLSILMVFLFLTFGCTGGSKIKGKVENVITEQPISDVAVVATMKTDIEEDKKYETRKTKTDKTGTFLLKGLSPKYDYTITATKPGYSVNETRLSPPPEGKTKILDRPFGLVKEPPREGVYLFVNGHYSERLQSLESHDFNRYDVHFYSGSAAGQPDLFYIKKGGVGKYSKF